MTPKERAIAALTLKVPDMVPTFELEFQLSEEMFGGRFLTQTDLVGKSKAEREKLLRANAEFMIKVYDSLEYSIIPVHYFDIEGLIDTVKYIRELSGDKFMVTTHGDGTFALPDGNEMYEFAYSIADDPDAMKDRAEKMALEAIERNKILSDGGFDSLILCSDYCFNSGPFISPAMFGEYIQPYLYKIIESAKRDGVYTIKHTDGNIMPILDQLVECRPHAIHSIDPMANVDIKEVKRLVGDKVALCGNVNCALMQTGTEAEVVKSAKYCLTHGMPRGGYIYCTSNVPFKGLPADRYQLVLDVWKRMRVY